MGVLDGIKSVCERAAEVCSLKHRLAATDYKVIKAYEYQLAGLEMPYDITGLHREREAIREQIRLFEE